MTKRQKKLVTAAAALALCLGILPAANAMHIMEGALPVRFCIAWGIVCIPFLLAGFFSIRKTLNANRRALTLLAMSGAFIFVISSLKIPSVSGSSSHMTGTGPGGDSVRAVPCGNPGTDRADFQALLLAHGGLTTLGATPFHGGGRSLRHLRPVLAFEKTEGQPQSQHFPRRLCGRPVYLLHHSLQLALAHNSATSFGVALKENLVIFAGTQIPLAAVEGILTVIIMIALEAYAKPELKTIGYLKEEN